MKKTLILASFVMLGAIAGCTDDTTAPSKAGTFKGPVVTVGNGSANTWVVLDNDGNPTSVGVTLTAAALENLPTSDTEYDLAFPSQMTGTSYNHMSLGWNPNGHPPVGIYDKPHFDVHFYQLPMEQRHAISPLDSVNGRKAPETDYIPAGYFTPPPGDIVPMMGIHWVDPTSPELSMTNPQPFTKTFIYGFYAGTMIFAEPMITKAYLETKPNYTEYLKLPAKYPKAGVYYATKYSVKFDNSKNEYAISLDSLVKR